MNVFPSLTRLNPRPSRLLGAQYAQVNTGPVLYANELSHQHEGPIPSVRLARLNCSRPLSVPGSFCSTRLANDSTLLYKPFATGAVAVQIQSTMALRLVNTSRVTVRNLDLVGPVERVLDVVGGSVLTVSGCSMRYGSFSAIAINFKSAAGSGLQGGDIVNNSMSESGSGLYVVNQGRAFDASANTNRLRVSHNQIFDLDIENRYLSRDNLAIGIQGGVGNVVERNAIHNVGGSCITLYQGPGQIMENFVIRYNFCSNVTCKPGSGKNQRGIEYDNANAVGNGTIPPSGNNSVYYNVIVNTSGVGMRSKALSMPGMNGGPRSSCTWRWENNVVVAAGVGFDTQYMAGQAIIHGDCVHNNIFACEPHTRRPAANPPAVATSRMMLCKPSYVHHAGWIVGEPSIDAFTNNLCQLTSVFLHGARTRTLILLPGRNIAMRTHRRSRLLHLA